MTDTDLAPGGDAGDSGFTAEEQALFDAYERGEELPAPGGAATPAPEAAAAAPEPAAAAPGAPAEDQVVDPDAEGADDPEANRGRFVRHGAFHRERERRKAAETELAQLRERFTRGDERLRLLTESLQQGRPPAQPQAPAQPEAPAAPNPEEDIFGAFAALQRELAELRQGQQKTVEEREAEHQHGEVVRAYQGDAARFAQAEPAFQEAYTFLLSNRAQELALNGFSREQITQALQADEMALARQCIASGVSPAERLFQMAKLRGFAPKAPEPAAPPAPAAPAETPAEKAARIQAGQTAAKSLSAAGGAPAAEMTLEALAAMSEAEFEAYAAKNPKRVAALMGAEA